MKQLWFRSELNIDYYINILSAHKVICDAALNVSISKINGIRKKRLY